MRPTLHMTRALTVRLASIGIASLSLVGCGGLDCPAGAHAEDDGLCYLDDGTTGADGGSPTDDGASDAGTTSSLGFELGDPITTLGTDTDGFFELVDAEMINDDYALTVGQGGFAVSSMVDGSLVVQGDADRGYDVAIDGDRAWVATRYSKLYELDLSVPTAPAIIDSIELGDPTHQDVALDNGLMLVGWLDQGAVIIDTNTHNQIGRLDVESARGVALQGDRALVGDEVGGQPQLVLFDVTVADSAVELDRVNLSGPAYDIAWEDDSVATAEGGVGAGVFTVVDDHLESRGQLSLPGTVLSVALDGDYLWLAAWEVAALAWVGDGDPVVLGHELPTESAMGITARNGRAMVADWFHTTALQANQGLAGPELVMDSTVYFDGGQTDSERMEVWNAGAMDLELSLEIASGDYSVSESSITLAPGERKTLLISPTSGAGVGALSWSSNDPDEPTGTVQFQMATTSVGTQHPDFEMSGFTWPDAILTNFRLTDFEGEVVFLAYWAEF